MACLTLSLTPNDKATLQPIPIPRLTLSLTPNDKATLQPIPIPRLTLQVAPKSGLTLTVTPVCTVSSGTIKVLAARDGILLTRDGEYIALNPAREP